jgi:hypothetical protein
MKKINLSPLSKIGFLTAILSFAACKSSFLPYNTTIAIQAERMSAINLTEKHVLIVSYDSDLSREFIISLKNYVSEELKNHKVVAERINIRQNEMSDDITDFNKLKSEFKPDYLLTIKVRDERTRKFYIIGGNVKTLRGMTVDFNLTPNISENSGTILWKSTAIINHFYNNEGVITAKKIAKELGVKMQKDSISD